MNREEFEKLPEIARHISGNYMSYDGQNNKYIINNIDLFKTQLSVIHERNEAWVNGAWYAWQEQQKKVDTLEKQAKCNHYWSGKSENQYCSKCGLS